MFVNQSRIKTKKNKHITGFTGIRATKRPSSVSRSALCLMKNMIEKDIEIKFVQTFVLKNKRERSIYELHSKKKRREFFHKLCHDYNEIIDSRFMRKLDPPNSNSNDIRQILQKEGAGKSCYVLSHFEEIDGIRMPLSEALDNCVGGGMPSIVICSPKKLAYFEAEQEVGPPHRFILRMK